MIFQLNVYGCDTPNLLLLKKLHDAVALFEGAFQCDEAAMRKGWNRPNEARTRHPMVEAGHFPFDGQSYREYVVLELLAFQTNGCVLRIEFWVTGHAVICAREEQYLNESDGHRHNSGPLDPLYPFGQRGYWYHGVMALFNYLAIELTRANRLIDAATVAVLQDRLVASQSNWPDLSVMPKIDAAWVQAGWVELDVPASAPNEIYPRFTQAWGHLLSLEK